MTRWLALTLLAACAQAHWECVDPASTVVAAGDATCKDFADQGIAVYADAEKGCADVGCTCRIVTQACEVAPGPGGGDTDGADTDPAGG